MFVPYGDEYSRPGSRRPATWAILLLNLLIFFLIESPVLNSENKQGMERFFLQYGLVPAFASLPAAQKEIRVTETVPKVNRENGEITYAQKSFFWRPAAPHWLHPGFLTSMFLHENFSHIAGNMLFFWIFAHNVEDALGSLNFIFFYLASGLGAGIAEVLLHSHSTVPVIGASGAIAGVLGAYLALFPFNLIKSFYWLFFFWGTSRIPAFYYIGFWFLMQLFLSAGERAVNFTGVAYTAHVAGFLLGILLVFLFPKRRQVLEYYRFRHRGRDWQP